MLSKHSKDISAVLTSSSIGIFSFFVWICSYPTARLTVGMPCPAMTFASLPPPLVNSSYGRPRL